MLPVILEVYAVIMEPLTDLNVIVYCVAVGIDCQLILHSVPFIAVAEGITTGCGGPVFTVNDPVEHNSVLVDNVG